MEPSTVVLEVRRFIGKQKAIAAALTTLLGTIGAALVSIIVTGNVDWTESRIALGGLALAGVNYLAVYLTRSPLAEVDESVTRATSRGRTRHDLPPDPIKERRHSRTWMRARLAAAVAAVALTTSVLAIAPTTSFAHWYPCGEVCAENHVYNVFNSHCGNGTTWVCVNRKVYLDAYQYGEHSWRVTYWFAEQQLPFGGVRECYVDARVDSHADAVVQFYGEYC